MRETPSVPPAHRPPLEVLWRAVFEESTEAIVISRAEDGTILDANEAWCRMTGFAREELLGRSAVELGMWPDPDERRALLEAARAAHGPGTVLVRAARRDGSIRYGEVHARAVEVAGEEILVASVRDVTDRFEAEEERRRLLSELLAEREEERQRIALDLHDDVLQSLTAALLQLQLLAEEDGTEGGRGRIERIERALRETLGRLRDFTFQLHPPSLDRVGLAQAVADLGDHLTAGRDVRVTVEDRTARRLPPRTGIVAYRIVQEALTNVLQHAEARSAVIRLETVGDELHVLVRDDGRGFDPEAVGEGPGIRTMRQRVELERGSLRIRSAAGRGTEVEVRLPLAPTAEG
ncbi:Oxygen sensor histidine kinase NreB [bacterium HR12]|nr:Oxygen sensor histidine kinase NreB [bacterium HR12]